MLTAYNVLGLVWGLPKYFLNALGPCGHTSCAPLVGAVLRLHEAIDILFVKLKACTPWPSPEIDHIDSNVINKGLRACGAESRGSHSR